MRSGKERIERAEEDARVYAVWSFEVQWEKHDEDEEDWFLCLKT
jgi:hypothetical protein